MQATENKNNDKTVELMRELVMHTFRLNGFFLGAGDRLIRDMGLTTSLRLVISILSDKIELSIPQIARDFGITRQSVRRTVNLLEEKGFVRFKDNPDHRRSKLVTLTEEGWEIMRQCKPIYDEWASTIADEIDPEQLIVAIRVMEQILQVQFDSQELSD